MASWRQPQAREHPLRHLQHCRRVPRESEALEPSSLTAMSAVSNGNTHHEQAAFRTWLRRHLPSTLGLRTGLPRRRRAPLVPKLAQRHATRSLLPPESAVRNPRQRHREGSFRASLRARLSCLVHLRRGLVCLGRDGHCGSRGPLSERSRALSQRPPQQAESVVSESFRTSLCAHGFWSVSMATGTVQVTPHGISTTTEDQDTEQTRPQIKQRKRRTAPTVKEVLDQWNIVLRIASNTVARTCVTRAEAKPKPLKRKECAGRIVGSAHVAAADDARTRGKHQNGRK